MNEESESDSDCKRTDRWKEIEGKTRSQQTSSTSACPLFVSSNLVTWEQQDHSQAMSQQKGNREKTTKFITISIDLLCDSQVRKEPQHDTTSNCPLTDLLRLFLLHHLQLILEQHEFLLKQPSLASTCLNSLDTFSLAFSVFAFNSSSCPVCHYLPSSTQPPPPSLEVETQDESWLRSDQPTGNRPNSHRRAKPPAPSQGIRSLL
eukprot:746016-Hanusia_phi.AAC.3